MSDDLNTEIKIGADASGVEAGVGKAKRSLKDLGDAAQKAGKDAGAGMASVGAGGDKAAKDVERATKTMQGALQRLLAEQKAGAKGSREYYEALADTRGISRNAIKPILDQIDAAKNKTLQAKNAADSWTASLGKVGPLVAAAFSGAAITGFLGKVVAVQREFDVLNSSLTTVTGSSAAAERELMWLKDFAKTTPFGLAQATQGFVKMKALGLDPTRAALTSFGNTASAMGKDLNQMIEAVADASTGEFERLKEFGIKAKKEGDSVSLTFQGVTTTIRNSAAEITKYLQDIGDTEFGGAMEQRAKTLDGTIAALGDTWDELFRTISSNNVGSLIFDSITLANGVLEDATTIVRAFGGASSEAAKNTGALTASQGAVAKFFETVAVLGAETLYVLKQTGDTLGGLAAGYKAFFSFDFDAVRAIGAEMRANGEAARKEIDATTARILSARKEQEEYARFATRNASAATDPRRVDLSRPSRPETPVTTGGGKSKKEELSDYDKLIQKLGVEIPKAAAEAEAAQMGYNKAQTEFLALAGSDVWAKFTDTQRATVAALFENKIVSEQAGEAAKTLAKANLDAAASRDKYLTSLATGIDKLKADIAAQQEATARMGLTKDAIAALDGAKLEMLATDLELQAIKALDRNLDQQTYDSLKEQAKLYRDLSAAKKDGAAKEIALDLEKANEDAAKDAAKEWERAADDINNSLTDALLRGFESGKGFAENLRDTLKNMFSTLVLRPIISAVLSPISGGIQGLMGGSAPGAAGGGIGGLMNLASLGKNAYSLYSNFAGASGLGGLSSFAGGYSGAILPANMIGPSIAQPTIMSGLGNTVSGFTGGAGGAGAGSAIAGAGAFAAVAAVVLNALGAFKSERKNGGGLMGTLGGGNLQPWEEWREGGTLFDGPSFNTINPLAEIERLRGRVEELDAMGMGDTIQGTSERGALATLEDTYAGLAEATAAQSKIIQTAYEAMRNSAVDMADALGLSSDKARDFTTQLGGDKGLNFDGLKPEEQQAKLTEALATANNEIAQQLIGAWETTSREVRRTVATSFGQGEEASMVESWEAVVDVITETRYVASEYARDGEKAIDTLTRLATSFATVRDLAADMRVPFELAGLAGADAASKIADAFGGLEPMTQQLAGYIENFYSETEKRENLARRSSGVLQGVGLDIAPSDILNASRPIVRGFVEAVLAEFGPSSPQYVAAVQQANVLAGLYEPLGAAAAAAADVMGEAMKRLQSDSASLQIELLRAQGNATGADAAQRTLDTTGLSAAEIAVYDYNTALRSQINVLNDAAQAAADQAEIRAGFERQLLEMQGDTTALRLLDIAGLDAANVALYDRVQALQAEQTAVQATVEASQKAVEAERGLISARAQAAQQAYSDAQAATGAALASIDRSVGAQREVFDASRSAALEAAQEVRSLIDTLSSGIKGLYGEVESARTASAAEGLAFIDNALRNARATGYLPDSSALNDAISSASSGIGAKQYTSQADQDFDRLVLAGQLKELNGYAEPQLTAAEQAARIAEDQIKALDDILRNARDQVDELRGIDTSVKSIPEALAALQAALVAESQAQTQAFLAGTVASLSGGQIKPQDAIKQLEGKGAVVPREQWTDLAGTQAWVSTGGATALGGTPTSGLDAVINSKTGAQFTVRTATDYVNEAIRTGNLRSIYDAAVMHGISSTSLDAMMGWPGGTALDWAKSQGLPAFAVGTNYVPRDMVARIHEGEAIVPKAYNPAAGGMGGQSNARVEALLEGMAKEIQRLQAIVNDGNREQRRTANAVNGNPDMPMLVQTV